MSWAWKRLAAPLIAAALVAILVLTTQETPISHINRVAARNRKTPSKIWVSMAVCFSSNTGFVVVQRHELSSLRMANMLCTLLRYCFSENHATEPFLTSKSRQYVEVQVCRLLHSKNHFKSLHLRFRFHSKAKFPYTLSTRLASKLWLNKTDVRTIVQVVFEAKDREGEALTRYIKELVDDGNHVVSAIETG